MSFGALMSIAVLVASAQLFNPRNIDISRYEQIALVLTPALHKWGSPIFGAALATRKPLSFSSSPMAAK